MVSNEVVMQTVKRMISSGVDDNTIRTTLKGINLSEEEIEKVMNEAKGITPQNNAPEQKQESQQKSEVSPEEEVPEDENYDSVDEEESQPPEKNVSKDIASASQEQAAQHTTTHTYLEEHGEKMDSVKKDISNLKGKINSTPSLSKEDIAKLSMLDKRMSSLEKEISETKANTLALQSLLKKILETNKKTLLKLEK